jgi:NADH-quinone oxidoreductase subunit K
MTLAVWLLLSTALFAIGLYGLLARRNAIAVLISIELMVNAASLNLVAFSRFHGLAGGQALAAFLIALTVAEIVVGLAIVVVFARARRGGSIDVDAARELRS